MAREPAKTLGDHFAYRFGEAPPSDDSSGDGGTLLYLARRRTHRNYSERPVDPALVETLAAAALCAPTKSDLQQRDIVIVRERSLRDGIDALFPGDR